MITTVPIANSRPTGKSAAVGSLLSVRGLVTEVITRSQRLVVLRGIDLDLDVRTTLGIAGESGSGKTMLALSILGLLARPAVRVTAGAIKFEGVDLVGAPPSYVRNLLGRRLSAVFQDPQTSLNPLFTVGEQIREVIRRHQRLSRHSADIRSGELLELVKIAEPTKRLRSYPHELSGGQRQRVAIAIAIANEPALLVADEPTTALDVTVQAEILELLAELRDRMGMSMLFISHDLGVIREICDRVVVMYAGRIVEESTAHELFRSPLHPYTRRLIECMPAVGQRAQSRPIPGMPPAMDSLPVGCAFADRCDVAEPRCELVDPRLVGDSKHSVACVKPGAKP